MLCKTQATQNYQQQEAHGPYRLPESQWLWRIFFRLLNFRYYLPLEKADHHDFNKFEFLSPKAAFSQVWLQLAQ
jgi:hypothetical protein